jgi:hypothetical protein
VVVAVATNSIYKLEVELFQIVAPFLAGLEASKRAEVVLAGILLLTDVLLVENETVAKDGLDKGML